MARTVAIANFRTKQLAEIAGGLLTNAELPFVIQSQEGMLHGPINPGATIYVSEERAEEAKALLADANMLSDGD